MSKLVLILSLLGLTILLTFGLTDPNSPVMWMASTSVNFAVLRGCLGAVLLGLLLTHPPRNVYFRTFVGMLCLTLVSWAVSATYENQMKFLDTLSLLEVSVSAGLIALERDIEEKLPFPRYEISSTRRAMLTKLQAH